MLRRFSSDFAIFSICLDSVLIALALISAAYIRPFLNQLPYVTYIPGRYILPTPVYLIFPLIWVLCLLLVSVYDGQRNLRVGDELTSLTLGSLLAIIALAGMLYLSFREVSRIFFITYVIVAYMLLFTWRLAYRLAFRWGWLQGVQEKRILIVGAGNIGRELSDQIKSYQHLGFKVIGYLDDDPQKQDIMEVMGTLDQARTIVQQRSVDDVVLALPVWAFDKVNQMVANLHDVPVKVWVIPDYFSLALHQATIVEFAGLPMLDLRAPALSEYQRMIKRFFDIVIASITLVIVIPFVAIISIAIYLDSPGNTIYRQKRVGENGRNFEMLKFRTMVVDAEKLQHLVGSTDNEGHSIHKHADDPRVTRVGRFLRRFSLDEFPQLINVLRGEMSIVGPRPEMPYLVKQYEPWQRKRFAVPQGITGWWQVKGRSDKPMHLNTEDDLYYVRNYSIFLDIQIMLMTIWVVLRGDGAF